MWHNNYKTRTILVLILAVLNTLEAMPQLSRLKKSRGGSSKFSLNPLKPLMKLVRDPLKASAQRHYAKYLPPPPGMFQQYATVPAASPPRTAVAMASVPWQRYYSPQPMKMAPQSTISIMPPMAALPSSLIYSLAGDRNGYRNHLQPVGPLPLPSDIQIKTLRLPARYRKPASSSPNLNLADSVVRQLLEYPNQENMPSVLVIEDPDISTMPSASNNADLYSDSISSQKQPTILLSPQMNGGDISDASTDLSIPNSAGSNPDVFVIVSKNSKNRGLYLDDKKGDIVSSGSTSKLKKYKITSSLDDYGNTAGRQVWIIKR